MNFKRRTRRYFTVEKKKEIAKSSFGAGITISAVARMYEIDPQILYRWRQQYYPNGVRARSPAPAPVPAPILVAAPDLNKERIAVLEKQLKSAYELIGRMQLRLSRHEPDVV